MSLDNNRGNDLHSECAVKNEVTGKEVAIQANPHEIERSQGQLPFRKRFVPVRFSDYGIFADNVKEDDEETEAVEDADFVPTESGAKRAPNNKDDKQKRSRGRPRKCKGTPDVPASCNSESPATENVKRNPITKVANGFKCGICGKIFTLRGNAKTHLITHTNDRPFPCDFKDCDKCFRTKESLRRHRLSHLGVKTFECSECSKKFSCNLSLQEHISRHTGQKPLSCEICGTKFRQIAVLKRHLTTHSNSKPFECEICGRKFSLKLYVRSHMKTHTGERPFSCDICNKCFAHASDLNRHKIIHSGKKPYQCSICPMRYSDPSSRRRHEREHESKPQYVCHLCKQQFPRAGQLRVHLVKEHTTTTTALDQQSVIQLPIKIESSGNENGKASSLTWYPGIEIETNNSSSPVVMDVQPGLVQAAMTTNSNSSADVGLGQEVNTVQIVLDSSCGGQDGSGNEQTPAPLQTDIHSSESDAVQTVVMELPQSSDGFSSLQGSAAAYKVIDTGNRVYEILVKEPSQEPFQGQDLGNEMKVNMSDLKMNNDRLVAFIEDGDTVTVMEQTDEAPQQTNDNNGSTIDNTSGDDRSINMVVNTIGEVLENNTTDNDPSVQREREQDIDLLTMPIEQQENINLVKEDQNSTKHCPRADVSQAGTMDKSEVQNYVNINDNSSLPAETESSVIAIPATAIYSPFIESPDLNSQEYYNWLSSFSEECKNFTMPLSKEVFTKISHVQKTLSDYMAMPSGVITDRNNFKILMGITQDLSQITSSHLLCMYSNLNT